MPFLPLQIVPVQESKWFIWRSNGTALVRYLLDSEVHTFAFSVAANAILSFIPFIVLLYTLAISVFRSVAMKDVLDYTVNYFLPPVTREKGWITGSIYNTVVKSSSHHGVQAFSLIMIVVACTGIFLPLEVALNQAWGVAKSRNYLHNQIIAFGLAILMIALGMASVLLNAGSAMAAYDHLFWSHGELLIQRNLSSGSCLYHRRRLDPFLLFHLLAFAQSQSPVASGFSHRCGHRHHLAARQIRSSLPCFRTSIWNRCTVRSTCPSDCSSGPMPQASSCLPERNSA